jgi:hypothetical protein
MNRLIYNNKLIRHYLLLNWDNDELSISNNSWGTSDEWMNKLMLTTK